MRTQERIDTNFLNAVLRPVVLAVAIGASGCSSGNADVRATETPTPFATSAATSAPVVHVQNKFIATVWALDTPEQFLVEGVRKPHCEINYIYVRDFSQNKYVDVDNNSAEVKKAMGGVHSEGALEMYHQDQPSVNGKLCQYKRG